MSISKIIRIGLCVLSICYFILLLGKERRIGCPDYEFAAAYVGLLNDKIIAFQRDTGYFPKTLDAMKCVKTENRDCVNYLATDPWGHELVYIYPAKYGNLAFDLYSKGRDGQDDFGKNDDMSNWNGFSEWVYNKQRIIDIAIFFAAFGYLLLCFASVLASQIVIWFKRWRNKTH